MLVIIALFIKANYTYVIIIQACKTLIVHILIAKFNFTVTNSSFITYANISEIQLRL